MATVAMRTGESSRKRSARRFSGSTRGNTLPKGMLRFLDAKRVRVRRLFVMECYYATRTNMATALCANAFDYLVQLARHTETKKGGLPALGCAGLSNMKDMNSIRSEMLIHHSSNGQATTTHPALTCVMMSITAWRAKPRPADL